LNLFAFGAGLDAAGANPGFFAGDNLAMQIDVLSSFCFDVGM
jgi:hypothetical protein